VQAARVGLVAAVNRYDSGRSNPFIVYAIVCITGELKRFLRDNSWYLHIARSSKERALQVVRARDALTMSLGRSPTVTEIAAHLSMSEDWVLEALEIICAQRWWSLSLHMPRMPTTPARGCISTRTACGRAEWPPRSWPRWWHWWGC
jgi:RNA polymerase sigma-B factor